MLDKALHIIASAAIVVTVWLLVRDLTTSSSVAFMLGIAKELHDYNHGRASSWYDILADVIGIIVGVLVVVLIA